MAVVVGSNISSLGAQRRLAESGDRLASTFERLASGQRINRASDDAAGLSIISDLSVGRRVYAQAVRNLNDGISLLQLADTAVESLSEITTRLQELAEQAANGTFSFTQRKAIETEARQLEREYTRISKAAAFNGTHLFDGSLQGGLTLQAGFADAGSIQSSLGGVMGNGTFSSAASYAAGNSLTDVVAGDVNGDGLLDLITSHYITQSVSVLLGRGDGTFSEGASYSVSSFIEKAMLGDVNGDGILDVVSSAYFGSTVDVLLGKGDGTFMPSRSFDTGIVSANALLGDVNGDGVLDFVTAEEGDPYYGVTPTCGIFIGRGDGSFYERMTFTVDATIRSLELGDLDGDGAADLVMADSYNSSLRIFTGAGDGTFSESISIGTTDTPGSLTIGDLNNDGIPDIAAALSGGNTEIRTFMGSGDGVFSGGSAVTTDNSLGSLSLGDLNGDGVLDLVGADWDNGAAVVLMGNGDGAFLAGASYAVGAQPAVTLGDLNGDGVLDIVAADRDDDAAVVLLGATREGVAPLLPFSLTSRADALQAMGIFGRKLNQLAAQRGVIGAFQSRLGAALDTLFSTTQNYAAAESRIRDSDVASEAAESVRLQISSQAASQVLAHANKQPALALQLLLD